MGVSPLENIRLSAFHFFYPFSFCTMTEIARKLNAVWSTAHKNWYSFEGRNAFISTMFFCLFYSFQCCILVGVNFLSFCTSARLRVSLSLFRSQSFTRSLILPVLFFSLFASKKAQRRFSQIIKILPEQRAIKTMKDCKRYNFAVLFHATITWKSSTPRKTKAQPFVAQFWFNYFCCLR